MSSAVYLVIGCVVAALAYRTSENFKRTNGITPWNWPSWLWALIGFFSLLLCVILMVIARRRTTPVHAAPYATSAVAYPTLTPGVKPSWQKDPTGRFASRYWDGSEWTEYVSDGGTTSSDPIRH